jgi:hypothetical protein
MSAPQQAFAAFGAVKPPATPRGRERQKILVTEANAVRDRYEWIGKYEWAKRRVCSVLGLVRYDQWNGYLPPTTDQNGKTGRTIERRLLVKLTHDLAAFEQTGELPDYATEGE